MRARVACATVAIVAGLALSIPAAASPATIVVCTASPGPSIAFGFIATSRRDLVATYYHRCNTVAGIQSMTGTVQLIDAGTGKAVGKPRYVVDHPQATAAGTTAQGALLKRGHSYYAQEVLRIAGSFRYGSVPGCGRPVPTGTVVLCKWHSRAMAWG